MVLSSGTPPAKAKGVSYSVNSKDLFDEKKNPNLCLSVKGILKNKKIRRRQL